jgi:hypothetical protein
MPDSLMARLWSGLLATSPLEALAVLSGIVYVVLDCGRLQFAHLRVAVCPRAPLCAIPAT